MTKKKSGLFDKLSTTQLVMLWKKYSRTGDQDRAEVYRAEAIKRGVRFTPPWEKCDEV